jgi:uncharacterized protein (TIGR02453 family)
MTSPIDLHPVLEFSSALKEHNSREWFQGHRAEYELARGHFEDLVARLIDLLSPTVRLGNLTPRDCIFRIHRDLRFSRDKTPYKPYMSAYIAPGGRRSRRLGYYIHIEPDHSMLAGGLHEPDPRALASFRAQIDQDPARFKRIVSTPVFRKTFGGVGGSSLKTAPRGYPRDHPDLDLLRLKSVTVSRHVPDKQVLSPRFLDQALDTFKVMKPFLDYLEALP